MNKTKTQKLILCSLFTALIAIGAFIKIPIPYVPVTLQFEFVILAAFLLGGKLSFVSVITYIALGLVGLPVFTEGGGISYVLKPTFGYIIGFAACAYVSGTIANKVKHPSFARLFISAIAGILIVYTFGMVHFYIIKNIYSSAQIGLWYIFKFCFLIFLPGDLLLSAVGALAAKKLIPILRK